MASSYTTLLGLVLPVQGELQGTWGDTVNNELTSLLDTAVAGTTTLSTDADVTLTTTTGAANQARQQIILWTANGTVTRNITAPAQSKTYVVINASAGTQSIVVRGVGPTAGVTILKGEQAVVAWNGSDFVKVSTFGGSPSFTNVTVTGTTTLSGLTASTALALDASKNVVSVTNTGTGNNVLATSPTLTTPNLGTPSAVTLTNATGLPVSTGISGLGANVATFLATPSSANLAAAVTDETGSGALVFATSPSLTTPTIGVATATSINKVAITAPATSATLTIANGKTLTANSSLTLAGVDAKTLTVNNSLTLAGTDATTMTFPAASTTVAGLGTTQTFTGINTFTPAARASGVASYFTLTTPADTGQTASTESIGANFTAGTRTWAAGALTLQRERVFAAPTYAFATASTLTTAVNVDIAAPVAGTNATITSAWALRAAASQFTGTVQVTGLNASQAVFTDANDNLVSNAITGTGNVVMSTSPTLTTPNLGTPSAITLTNATGLPVSTGISGLGTGVATFLATPSSANLAAAVTDETGSGALVFATSPALTTPNLGTPSAVTLTNATGLPVSTGISGLGTGVATFLATPSSANLAAAVTDETGSGALVFATSPSLTTPTLGVATATSINKVTITAPATSATLTIANGKTLTANNSITLAGTDATTMTFPAASTTVAGLGTTQTFTGINTFTPTARSSGVASYFTLTTPADTGQTASTESIGANFTAATRTWATGALTLQRERVFAAPTYAFAGASTLTTAVNVDIALPAAGANATITNAYALRASASYFTSTIRADGAATFGSSISMTNSAPQLSVGSSAVSTGTCAVEVGIGRTGNGASYIDLIGDATYTDYGLRVIRNATGANTTSTIVHRGTGDFQMVAQDAAVLAFLTSNTERMRLDTSGNLGIGTSSPNYKLDVRGGVIAGGNGTIVGGISYSTRPEIGAISNHPVGFITNNTTQMLLDTSGNFGVGTSSPGYKLDVNGQARLGGSAGLVFGVGTAFVAGQAEVYSVSTTPMGIGTTGAAALRMYTNSVLAATIDASGNLGVGTSSPATKLEVSGAFGTSTTGITLTNSTGFSASNIARFDFKLNNSFGGSERVAAIWALNPNASANNGGALVFGTSANGTATTPTEGMRLDSSGNLGIGTSSPAQRLDVRGAENGVHARFGSVSNRGLEISTQIVSGTTDAGCVLNARGASAGTLIFQTESTERARITSGGDLLVGTTSSYGRLSVESSGLVARFNRTGAGGNAEFKNGDDAGYGISFLNAAGTVAGSIYWTATTTTFATSSDERLKENIVDAPDASSIIDGIKVRSFDWKADGTHQRFGVIAQEIEQVAPEAVGKPAGDDNQFLGVDYSKLVPMLIKEIQSLRARVAALESQP